MENHTRDRYCIQSVDNALHLLEVLCESDKEANISELSTRTGLCKSTIFRLLTTFQRRGYVELERGSHGYRLGVSAFEIGHKCLSQMTLLGKARPAMEQLARQSRESIYLAVRRGEEIHLLDQADNPQQVRVTSLIGRRIPLADTATGQVFSIFDKSGPAAGIPSKEEDAIRRRGYALMKNDIARGVISLAAPLLDYQNRIPGALLMVAPEFRLASDKFCALLAEQLLAAAESVSLRLGYCKPHKLAKGA